MTIMELAGIVARAFPDKQVYLSGSFKKEPTAVLVTEKSGGDVLLALSLTPEGAIRAKGQLKFIANQPAV